MPQIPAQLARERLGDIRGLIVRVGWESSPLAWQHPRIAAAHNCLDCNLPFAKNQGMRAIIIGAGRGIRLMPNTTDTPKCFAEVQGKRLLDWGLQALSANGISDICFIGGYRIEKVRADYPNLTLRHNADWERNNIMASLMYAEDLMTEPFVCAYSDILFNADVVRRILANPADIALSVDINWLKRYDHRSNHPPTDAEKVTVADGYVTRIHRGIEPNIAHGEYTGIAKFSTHGAATLKQHYHRCKSTSSGKPFREAVSFEKAYLIHLFQEMIEAGVKIAHADTPGNYIEIDTQQDFELAQGSWRG